MCTVPPVPLRIPLASCISVNQASLLQTLTLDEVSYVVLHLLKTTSLVLNPAQSALLAFRASIQRSRVKVARSHREGTGKSCTSRRCNESRHTSAYPGSPTRLLGRFSSL